MKGSYFLLLSNEKRQKKKIGRTLELEFPIGYYIYIGSAMGNSSTSLENRLNRHVTSAHRKYRKHPHWHIDHLLVSPYIGIVSLFILPNSAQKDECDLSRNIQQYSNDRVSNFGSSDCSCRSHLYFFAPKNSFIQQLLIHGELNLPD